MAPLAHALALLAMTVATVANKVKPLDVAKDSFDDQYQNCRLVMTEALPALKRSELQQNPLLAQVWAEAAARWQRRGPPESPLTPDQATAVIAFAMDDLNSEFNEAVSTAGRSLREYRDNFHFKALHFLLTDALATLKVTRGQQCKKFLHCVCGVQFVAEPGNTVRFDRFVSVPGNQTPGGCSGKETSFYLYACHGVDVVFFTGNLPHGGMVILPSETFEVVQVTRNGDKTEFHLKSIGTFSNYNCEWLKLTPQGTPSEGGDTRGGSVAMAPFHLRGILLATTALAVATGIL